MHTVGTFRGWAKLALLALGFALACDVAAALIGPPSDRTSGGGLAAVPAALGFFAGLGAFGAACVARAYWENGDGNVSGARRFTLAFVAPTVLMVVTLVASPILWYVVPDGRLWLWIVGPPLVLATERLAAPLLSPRK